MSGKRNSKSPTEARESRLLVSYGFELARKLEIQKVLVVAKLLTDRRIVDSHRDTESIIWVTDEPDGVEVDSKLGDHCVGIPRSSADRMDLVSLALIISVMKGIVSEDESVVCLLGAAGSKRLDNLLIANPKRDFNWFGSQDLPKPNELPVTQEFVRLVEIALKFSAEGREGKSIGTVFLLGDIKELKTIARPLILNPCKGHPKRMRNINDSDFLETIREYSALDGGFLVDRKGYVESAGVYLDAPVTKKVKVQKGLGSRHLAAAAATAYTRSLAVVISESSGAVTVFSEGAKILSLSRPV